MQKLNVPNGIMKTEGIDFVLGFNKVDKALSFGYVKSTNYRNIEYWWLGIIKFGLPLVRILSTYVIDD